MFKCPKCDTVIYSRRHRKCGQCGESLPDELLLSPEQVQQLDEQMKREHQRAKEFDLGHDGNVSL